MSLDEALAQLIAAGEVLAGTETVSTFDADGRVLAEDIVAELQVPPNDNSAMDGYAVRVEDLASAAAENPVALPVSQRIAAGSVGAELATGTCARIFTGAPVPAGANAVVMQEDTDASEVDGKTLVAFKTVPRKGMSVRLAGEDIALGSVVLAAGTILSPAQLGLAASVGRATLTVRAKPRVAMFSTGDELVMPGDIAPAKMTAGAIYNSNRFFLRAMLQRLGCEVTDFGIVPDTHAATVDALRKASAQHDLILTSGGVSVGEEDHVKSAVQELGELRLWQMSMKPGKPFAYGRVGNAHFVGLPGNPVSSYVTFVLMVRPFVDRLLGVAAPASLESQALQVPAHFNWPKPDRRREFLRVRRNAAGGLDLFEKQGSGVLTSVSWADGLVDVASGQTIAHGDLVRFLPFTELMR